VSWTFEVSAAAETGARAKKARKKRSRVKTPPPEVSAAPIAATAVEPFVPREIPHIPQRPPLTEQRPTHGRTIALGSAAALVIAALAFPRLPSVPADDDVTAPQPVSQVHFAGLFPQSPQADIRPAARIAAPGAASTPIPTRSESTIETKTRVTKPESTRAAKPTLSSTPNAAVTPVAEIPLRDSAPANVTESDAVATPAQTSVANGVAEAPVTITGCLEVSVDQDDFRLTDTEGADAPRSRSWRTGFLKKRSTPIALVDAPDRIALQTHVGRRVSATGLLTSHDLKVSALRVVGPSCN
jgi:hypothetical protein